jgi:hypothetical protein
VSSAIATIVAIGVAALAVSMLRQVPSGAEREADAGREAAAERDISSDGVVVEAVPAEC